MQMPGDASETLDDFFAKKDKKKTKKTKSVFTADDFNPVAEKPKKKKNKTGKLEDAEGSETKSDAVEKIQESPRLEQGKDDDQEWNDFALEKEADYSGLRIQKLKIEESVEDVDEEIEYDEEGKAISCGGVQVWKIPEAAAAAANSRTKESTTEVESTVEEKPQENAAPQKYIPPAQRAAMKAAASGKTGVPPGVRRNPKSAPDISNEELFPSLGSSLGGKGNPKVKSQSPFNERSGKLITDVSLQNKWDALSRGTD